MKELAAQLARRGAFTGRHLRLAEDDKPAPGLVLPLASDRAGPKAPSRPQPVRAVEVRLRTKRVHTHAT